MNESPLPLENFPALDSLPCRYAFVTRIAGIDVAHDKAEALRRLESEHEEIRRAIGLDNRPLLTAEQVHGNKIAVVDDRVAANKQFLGCDGMITKQRDLLLGIHVADCCAVYIVEPKTPAIGLVHSGKKGTELSIAARAIEQMVARFGSDPADMTVQLSPCIRPPHYEINFAAEIVRQCRSSGVKEIHDCGVCTACQLDRYYSYRAERGKTGRMLALLGLD